MRAALALEKISYGIKYPNANAATIDRETGLPELIEAVRATIQRLRLSAEDEELNGHYADMLFKALAKAEGTPVSADPQNVRI